MRELSAHSVANLIFPCAKISPSPETNRYAAPHHSCSLASVNRYASLYSVGLCLKLMVLVALLPDATNLMYTLSSLSHCIALL